jgi:hypothetical protein
MILLYLLNSIFLQQLLGVHGCPRLGPPLMEKEVREELNPLLQIIEFAPSTSDPNQKLDSAQPSDPNLKPGSFFFNCFCKSFFPDFLSIPVRFWLIFSTYD